MLMMLGLAVDTCTAVAERPALTLMMLGLAADTGNAPIGRPAADQCRRRAACS